MKLTIYTADCTGDVANCRYPHKVDATSAAELAGAVAYEATKKERDRVAAEIRQKGIRRREFQRFITALEKLLDEVTEFEESMWSDLVESLTVYDKDDLRFMLPCGTEIKV